MPITETDLYLPVKKFLEGQGYTVKGEVGRCDVVAVRGDEDPIIVEMKVRFSLEVLFQAVERLAVTDKVYVAIDHGRNSLWTRRSKHVLRLCRSLGIGLLTIHPDRDLVEPRLDPGPYQRRPNKKRKERLLREFSRRVGDPNIGGSAKKPVMTAYRQDALRCARALRLNGPLKLKELRMMSNVERAASILQRDVYGWFERVERGIYALSPAGDDALLTFKETVDQL
ncbi:MAG: DUF2161 domain-containing phosphodiesterase [Geminicoccales bacterium]